MADIIKSRGQEFELVNGDVVLDNGACCQLTSRGSIGRASPLISKKEMKKYMALPNVTKREYNQRYIKGDMFEYIYTTKKGMT